MAPACSAAESNQWNSGRLVSISPSVEPGFSPSPDSPAVSAWTRSPYSRQVMVTSSSFRRRAGRSGCDLTVSWKASAIVEASRPAGRPVRRSAVMLMLSSLGD